MRTVVRQLGVCVGEASGLLRFSRRVTQPLPSRILISTHMGLRDEIACLQTRCARHLHGLAPGLRLTAMAIFRDGLIGQGLSALFCAHWLTGDSGSIRYATMSLICC